MIVAAHQRMALGYRVLLCKSTLSTTRPEQTLSTTNPPWFDPRMPDREACVLRHMLDRAARLFPQRNLALFENGMRWSYAEAHALARRIAAGLRDLGIRRGDMVQVWLPNGPEATQAWFGINYLGAVFAPVNTSYRGRLLEHVL